MTEYSDKDVLSWIRTIQQALTIEAENGFNNFKGRKENFDSFVFRQLSSPVNSKLFGKMKLSLGEFAEEFVSYSQKSDSGRRRLITRLRKILHDFSRSIEPSSPTNPPRLNISEQSLSKNCSSELSKDCLSLDSSIFKIRGVGPKLAEKLAGLGIFLVKDLLQHYPRDYVDYTALKRINSLKLGETATIVATIRRSNGFKSPRNPNLSILDLQLQDETGKVKVTKFFAGRRYGSNAFIRGQVQLYPQGATVALSGLVKTGKYGMTFHDPIIEVLENSHTPIKSKSIGRLLPIYTLKEGLRADRYRDVVDNVLPLATKWQDPLPESIRISLSLSSKGEAMFGIHRPNSQISLQKDRRRLVFDEFLLLQLGLLSRRANRRKLSSPYVEITERKDGLLGSFLQLLPFSFTSAQQKVLGEIEVDLSLQKPMSRLVQGDVGSGKTVIALAALLIIVEAGWQGAFMAPTEVLAEQHYKTLCKWLTQLNVTVELLTGSTTRRRRRQLLDDLANNSLKILVGTHALIEDDVLFNNLGLVIVDEQHRFGVHQRSRLLGKGLHPHLLAMTATPIPRTMALSIHGDLDVSQIDELPPGRTPIKTTLLPGFKRDQAYELILKEVERGQQAYVVLPLVEESEKLDLRSAVEVFEDLSRNVFLDLNVGLLHGRLNSTEKKEIINAFSSGECQVLISTTVIEVGVDVPRASVMVIDHADRFGLSQLHQLRGRVGRGAAASHCVLINENPSSDAKTRLEVLRNCNDGFEIAEIDLRLRGPGQVLGTRQSGLPDLALASLAEDGDILEEARKVAEEILEIDPDLSNHPQLKHLLDTQWSRISGTTQLN